MKTFSEIFLLNFNLSILLENMYLQICVFKDSKDFKDLHVNLFFSLPLYELTSMFFHFLFSHARLTSLISGRKRSSAHWPVLAFVSRLNIAQRGGRNREGKTRHLLGKTREQGGHE